MITIIAALDPSGGIGLNNQLPWHSREEMAHFREVTMGHTLVMGRRTYEGIGKPLEGRRLVVVSRDPSFARAHAEVSVRPDLKRVLEEARSSEEEIFVCGGQSVYQASLPYADRLLISRMKKSYPCDARFPAIDPRDFSLDKREERGEFTIEEYRRTCA